MGTGCREKPQGSPWQSLLSTYLYTCVRASVSGYFAFLNNFKLIFTPFLLLYSALSINWALLILFPIKCKVILKWVPWVVLSCIESDNMWWLGVWGNEVPTCITQQSCNVKSVKRYHREKSKFEMNHWVLNDIEWKTSMQDPVQSLEKGGSDVHCNVGSGLLDKWKCGGNLAESKEKT